MRHTSSPHFLYAFRLRVRERRQPTASPTTATTSSAITAPMPAANVLVTGTYPNSVGLSSAVWPADNKFCKDMLSNGCDSRATT